MKNLILFISMLFLLPLLFACKSEAVNPEGSKSGIYPLTIIDSNGDEVTIQKEPEFIISASPNITEAIYALGAGDKLIARSDFCDYPPEALEIESIGMFNTPDIERILELNPDLVIASAHFRENAVRLRELGLNVLALYEDENFEGSYSLIENLGLALNREAEANEIVSGMKSLVAQTTSLVSDLSKPSVYYVVAFGVSGDFTAGGNTFIGEMIEKAGGDNIAKNIEGWGYNLENLLEADPDIIIISNQFDSKEIFINADSYKELTAVKNGRVYEIENNMLDRQGVRNADGLRALAEILHPEAFAKKGN